MTREEKLWSMTMMNLVSVAEKLGVKIDKKGAKAKAIEKILAAEDAKNAKTEKLVPMPGAEKLAELKKAVDEDTCADGRKYSEIGKEIAKQAKEKAKKAKTEKKAKVEKKSAEKKEKKVAGIGKVAGQQKLIKLLDAKKKNYRIAGKRLRFLDDSNKCYAYILFNNSNVKFYITDKNENFKKIEKIAGNNTYVKSRYNKTISANYDDLDIIVNLANTKTNKKEEK